LGFARTAEEVEKDGYLTKPPGPDERRPNPIESDVETPTNALSAEASGKHGKLEGERSQKSKQNAEVDEEVLLKRAKAARDEKVSEIQTWSANKRNKVATVIGAYDPSTRAVAVGVKITGQDEGKCAEDLAAEKLGNPDPKTIVFTQAIRPRNNLWIIRCDRCTDTFGPEKNDEH